MRVFLNCVEAFEEIEREMFEMGIDYQSHTVQNKVVFGTEAFETKELIAYTYSLSNWDDWIELLHKIPGMGSQAINYCVMEARDRVTNDKLNPGNSWLFRKDIWESYLNERGEFDYTYNERFLDCDQVNKVIEELVKFPNTRQAVITVFDKHYDSPWFGGKKRIPCSMYYHFILRKTHQWDKELTLVYNMRSCDLYTHFAIDMVIATKLLEFVASSIGAHAHRLIHTIDSLHAFKKDWDKRRIF